MPKQSGWKPIEERTDTPATEQATGNEAPVTAEAESAAPQAPTPMSDAEKRELAAILNVNPKFL